MALKASDILARLSPKARQFAIFEEKFTANGVEMVLQNLTAEQHAQVQQELEDVPEERYMAVTQEAQLCRAIVEIDGIDLRDSPFIEVGATGTKETRLMERHTWVADNLVRHWGREGIFTVWRKLAELLVRSEKEIQEGVRFDLAVETGEEKLRRLIIEAADIEATLPTVMVENIYAEHGWMPKSTPEEIEAATRQVREMTKHLDEDLDDEDLDNEEVIEPAPIGIPTPADAPVPDAAPRISPEILMALRQPLNRPSEDALPPTPSKGNADLDGLKSLGLDPGPVGLTPSTAFRFGGATDLARPQVVSADTHVVVDAAPVAGINPRFQPKR